MSSAQAKLRSAATMAVLAVLVLLGVIVLGNLVGLATLVAALVSASSGTLGGAQLLFTAAAIWIVNVIVFGL